MHPIRLAVVKVFDIDSGGVEQLMGQGSTAKDGTYTIRARGGDAANGPDIRVKVFSAIRNNAVVGVGPTLTSFYAMQSPIYTNFTGGSLNVSLTTGRPVRGSAADHVGARAFSVLDASLQAAAEA